MVKIVTILLCFATFCIPASAQLCPGGGRGFSNAIMFDPAWIYGCATGTSCNGGVNFDNRLSCEPTPALDLCAPLPTCSIIANLASDIWFKFYATYPNVTLACVQNTSLVIGIQAFNGGTCGALTQMGCAVSAGPSSGVQLFLTGLVPGQLYYFRVFGAGHVNPQRTGLYCFCGTQGISPSILPLNLESLKAIPKGDKVELSVDKPSADDQGQYEIEYSADGTNFNSIFRVNSMNTKFIHAPQNTTTCYYRIKRSLQNGEHHYSSITKVTMPVLATRYVFFAGKKEIKIETGKKINLTISDLSGRLLISTTLAPGTHTISTAHLSSGMYVLNNTTDSEAHKFLL